MGLLSRMGRAATALSKYYYPFTWRNKPSIESPINEVHLNHIEDGINEMDNRILILAQDKADATDIANVFVDFAMDDTTGVMTFTRFDGSKVEHDSAVEKIALNCYLEDDNFVLELADGTKQKVSLSKFIDTYEFSSTDTIRMTVNGKNISAEIPDGKITLAKLEPTIMSTIRKYTLDAQTAQGVTEQAASTAQGWAIGGTGFEDNNAKHYASRSQRYAVGGVEEGDTEDNAKYYCQQAQAAAEHATGAVGFDGTASTVSAIDTQGIAIRKASGTGHVTITDAAEHPILNLNLAGKSEQGADPNPNNPQEIVSTDVTAVTVTGAQLLDMTQAKGGTNGGITIVVNKDGFYSCTGTATNSDINVWLIGKYMEEAPTLFILKSGTYYKSGIRLFNGRKIIGPIFDGEFTLAEDTPVTGVRALQLEAGKTYSNYTVYPMINAGSTALPWQPYQSRTATITLTEPLHGIGDYRDRIMCRDGVWGIERTISQIDNTGMVPIIESLEILDTPTWEPLPSDTQSALNALTTYTGTTHVTITAGGPEPDVGVEYFGQPGDKVTVQDMCDSFAAPGFDDSGDVQGISGFGDFLNRMTSGMRLPSFFRDLKAGLKFVLHTGQLVNNGLCNEPGKYPLDAAYGRTLLEMIGNTANLPGGAADIVSAIVTQNSNLSQKANSSDLTNVSNVAAAANGKVELSGGPIKIIAYSGDGKWAYQQQYNDGKILSLSINDTQIAYDYYDGKTWTNKWTK